MDLDSETPDLDQDNADTTTPEPSPAAVKPMSVAKATRLAHRSVAALITEAVRPVNATNELFDVALSRQDEAVVIDQMLRMAQRHASAGI